MVAAKADLAPLPGGLMPFLVTREQAATMLAISPGAFDDLVKGGKLPAAVQFGGRLRRWDIKAIREALDVLGGSTAQSAVETRRESVRARIKAVIHGGNPDALRHKAR